jgi:hypothetical protein
VKKGTLMRRPFLLLALLAVATLARGEAGYFEAAVVSTSQTVTINAGEVLIINDDSTNEVYVRVFYTGETPAPATTANLRIKALEGISFGKTLGVKAVSLICASGETATVRLIY